MRSLEELENEYKRQIAEYGMAECSVEDMCYEELLSQKDVALRMWADVMIDYCNNYDGRFEFMYEMFHAMVDDGYKPTYNIFQSYLVDTMRENNGKPKYAPTDESEMDKLLDRYQCQKKESERYEEFRKYYDNKMIQKFGVEWLSMSGRERLIRMLEDIKDDLPLPPRKNSDDSNKEDIEDDETYYDDIPF